MLEVELLAAPDDRLEVRGNIVDLRKTGVVPLPGDVQNAGFVHHMQLGLSISASSARVDEVRVSQPYVAMEATAGTGGECCRDPAERLLALEGEQLVPGFEKHISRLFGGPLGCSHLMTLGQTVGRALPYAIDAERSAQRSANCSSSARREPGERIFKRTVFVDGLSSQDGTVMELALQQSDLMTTPRAALSLPLERLDRHHEVQAHASVAMDGFGLASLSCQVRARRFADAGSDAWTIWQERTDDVVHLVGERIMPGLGSRLLASFGQRADRRLLLDALLHLGPGFLQCIAALGDGGVAGMLGGRQQEPSAVERVGGNTDACYMWRGKGELEQKRTRHLARLRDTARPEADEA